jgi:hypothetical protein
MLKTLLREPLVHFAATALLLFAIYDLVAPENQDVGETVIVVDRTAALTFLQFRMKSFDAEAAAARFEAMSPKEQQRLIDDYVRQEALYREALALGLEQGDYIIKLRLIQKVEFLAQGLADATTQIDEAGLAAYFEEHREDYATPPDITFTHVFFDADRRGAETAKADAQAKLVELNATAAPFTDAPRHGDRFPYHLNYVERTPDYVASHFGPATAEAIFELAPDDAVWRGPFQSPYGVHLVLLTKHNPAGMPGLEEIRARVEQDALREARRARTEAAIDDLLERYEVRIDLSLTAGASE